MQYTKKCNGDSVFSVYWIRQVSTSILQVVFDDRLPLAVQAAVKAALRDAIAAHYKGPPGFVDYGRVTVRLTPTDYSKNMPDAEVDELALRATTQMATALGFTVEDDARYWTDGVDDRPAFHRPVRNALFHVCRHNPETTPPSKTMHFTR